MSDQYPVILKTKLNRPAISRGVIDRPQLYEQLNVGINRPLTLVLASAGFGKTTLVSTWLDHMAPGQGEKASMPSVWLSLDENDSELNVFIRYFFAAVRTIFAEACAETLMLLQATRQPPLAVLYTTFSNELEQLPEDFILVLDDYHTVHGVDVHDLLSELARHWPKPLHLVLISHIDPPLPLSGMRAKGMLSEIRTQDLRFTPEETTAYLSEAHLTSLGQPALNLLEERLEGWPAGLHLAALSLRSAGSPESVMAVLSSENANITGYLLDEVLVRQVPAIQTFLLKTSILDRFCAGLCEAVNGDLNPAWNAQDCLDWIERSELFITALDNRREWFRYHHLFRELLRQRLSAEMRPDQVTDLRLRASVWFEEQGLIDEALHYALAAGDLDLAIHQMQAGLRDAVNRIDRPTLERWLHLLPEEMIQQHPGLLMIRVWVLEWTWQIDQQAKLLQLVEGLLGAKANSSAVPSTDEVQILQGQILSLRAQQAYFSNQLTLGIDLCRQVLALLPPAWTFVRGGAMLYLGMCLQASGQGQEAERLLRDEYESTGEKTNAYAQFLLLSLSFNSLNSGLLKQTHQIAQILLQAANRSGILIMKNWGDWFLGLISYQRNELEAAGEHFGAIIENRYTAQIATYRDAVASLALIHQIQGERSAAWQMVESISQYDLELSGSEDERTRCLRARLLLAQGNLEEAGDWVDTFNGLPPDQALLWIEEPQVTRTRILIARGAEADLRLALQILDALDEIAERTHNPRYTIEILALRALALEAQGESVEADGVLQRALDLARVGGFIRVFADLGDAMRGMLQRLAKQEHSVEMIRRILVAFPGGEMDGVGGDGLAPVSIQLTPENSALVEPLTRRELEVLTLLREPLSIKEISRELNITYATARRHTINLYGKLGVNQRWKAVTRAEELNILLPR